MLHLAPLRTGLEMNPHHTKNTGDKPTGVRRTMDPRRGDFSLRWPGSRQIPWKSM